MGENAVPDLAHGQAQFLEQGIQLLFFCTFHKR